MKKATTNTIFGEAIVLGGTIHSKSAARITGDKVGIGNYATWKSATTKALNDFYAYKYAVSQKNVGLMTKEQVKAIRDKAMDTLKEVLDLVGAINGFNILRDEDTFDEVCNYAVRETVELIGPAKLVDSQVKNLRKELSGSLNGVNPEWLANKEAELAEKEEELKQLKKEPGSGRPKTDKASLTSFCGNFERKLYKLVDDQAMKSPEQIEAERDARRAKKKAERQAERQAAAKARKEAEAEAKKEAPAA